MYPNQFVKVEVIESHVREDKEYVDEVAFIKAITDRKEAMREFRKCKDNQIIYSTKNEELVIQLMTKLLRLRDMEERYAIHSEKM